MPNWCDNTLVVEGPAADIAVFKAKAQKVETESDNTVRVDVFSFDALIPMPEELKPQLQYGSSLQTKEDKKKNLEKYGAEDGISWQRKNWGIKWGPCSVVLDNEDPNWLVYIYETPWGPGVEGHSKIAKMFPALKFTLYYDEPGMDFAGDIVWEGGVIVSDEQYESQINAEGEDEDEDKDMGVPEVKIEPIKLKREIPEAKYPVGEKLREVFGED